MVLVGRRKRQRSDTLRAGLVTVQWRIRFQPRWRQREDDSCWREEGENCHPWWQSSGRLSRSHSRLSLPYMGSSQLPTVESPPSSLSHILSLACYNCGSSTAIEEPADETMIRRASMSRRQEHIQSPPIRSRSTERYQPEPDVSKLSFNDDEDDANAPAVSAGSLEPPHHRRVFSDPFDTAEDLVQEEEEEQPAPEVKPDPHALTTLPRFPVQETRNKNCWSQPPVDIFSVRGPRYFDDKKKVQSGPYLLQSRGCDLFLTDKPVKLLDKCVGVDFVGCAHLFLTFVRQKQAHSRWPAARQTDSSGQLSLPLGSLDSLL